MVCRWTSDGVGTRRLDTEARGNPNGYDERRPETGEGIRVGLHQRPGWKPRGTEPILSAVKERRLDLSRYSSLCLVPEREYHAQQLGVQETTQASPIMYLFGNRHQHSRRSARFCTNGGAGLATLRISVPNAGVDHDEGDRNEPSSGYFWFPSS